MSTSIDDAAAALAKKFAALDDKRTILNAPELRELFGRMKDLPPAERPAFGQAINKLKEKLQADVDAWESDQASAAITLIDVTAPFDTNVAPQARPQLLTADRGSRHPLMTEIRAISDIFYRMGFVVEESRQLDDEYHMFTSLNFPQGHPARDDYDSFMTVEADANGHAYIAPAHTSTMQNRVLQQYRDNLAQGRPIGVVLPDRVFRNEDLDARHEHTFYQIEGVYVNRGVHAGNLVATIKAFLQEYYQRDLNIKIQPFYFPFTEPSFEFAASCPFCDQKGCNVCSYSGWIELGGCGMIHPNVLTMAGIDPAQYTGFAWGFGIDRLVMMKHSIEDVRHFESGKLDFLRQFV